MADNQSRDRRVELNEALVVSKMATVRDMSPFGSGDKSLDQILARMVVASRQETENKQDAQED